MSDKTADKAAATESNEPPVIQFDAIGGNMKETFDNVFREAETDDESGISPAGPASHRAPVSDGRPTEEPTVHPATLALLSRMPPLLARGLVYAVLIFLVVAVAWAHFSMTDIVVRGQGIVVPQEDQVHHVHATIPAVVNFIAETNGRQLQPGDRVKKGQELIRLEARDLERLKTELAQAELEFELKTQALARHDSERKPELDTQLQKLDARRQSLQTIISTAQQSLLTLNVERGQRQNALNDDIAAKRRRLEKIQTEHATQIKMLDNRKAQLQATLESTRDSLQNLQALESSTRSEYQNFASAAAQGMLPYERVTAAYSQYLAAQNQLRAANADLKQLPLKIDEIDVQKEQLVAQLELTKGDIQDQIRATEAERDALQTSYSLRLRDYERQIAESQASIADVEMQQAQLTAAFNRERESLVKDLDRATLVREQTKAQTSLDNAAKVIVAPIDGEITKFMVDAVGTYVQPGQLLVTIADPAATKIVLITVENRDIAKLKDQPVKFKFDAYPYQQYGIVRGELTAVSPDAIQNRETGESVYQLRARFENYDSAGEVTTTRERKIGIKYGMTANAEIVQRQRSILDLMLDPIRQLGESLNAN